MLLLLLLQMQMQMQMQMQATKSHRCRIRQLPRCRRLILLLCLRSFLRLNGGGCRLCCLLLRS